MLHLSTCAHLLCGTDRQTEDIVAIAAKGLRHLLDPDSVLHLDPLLLISFDEAHSLTDEIRDRGTKTWTRFTALGLALRSLHHEPFFAIFLSTAGKLRSVHPHLEMHHSFRVQGFTLGVFPPVTAVGFDEFADRVSIDGTWTLTRLASTYHMTHLGRAL